MKNDREFILHYIDEFVDFIAGSNIFIYIILDINLKISAHNECFKKLLRAKKNLVGQSIHTYLLQESQGILPLSDSTRHLSIGLNFISSLSAPIPLDCHIFKVNHDQHLIMGGHHMLTSEKVFEKMSVLNNELANMARDLHRKNKSLEEAQSKIKILSGIIPICMHCKEIRDDQGYWNRLEKFISDHSEARFSHGICPSCMEEHYPDF